MHLKIRTLPFLGVIPLLLSAACTVSDSDENAADTQAAAPGATGMPLPGDSLSTGMPTDTGGGQSQTVAPVSDLRIEVDLSSRLARVFRGSDSVAAYRRSAGRGADQRSGMSVRD